MSRFSKLGKLFAATAGVAAIAASIGLAVRPATAADAVDNYKTGTPHIYINKGTHSAAPEKYPERFKAIQVFSADASGDDHQLSNITWGASIDATKLLQNMASSTEKVGRLTAVPSGVKGNQTEYGVGEEATEKTFGELFKAYCKNNIDKVENPDSDITTANVTAHDVAQFLNYFAYGEKDAGLDGTKADGPYSHSKIAEAFTRTIVKASIKTEPAAAEANKGGDQPENPEWTSYGLQTAETEGTTVSDNLYSGAGAGDSGLGWVIDEVNAGTSEGLPTGYYLVYDTFSGTGEALSEHMLQVVDGDGVYLNIKSDVPTLEKNIDVGNSVTDADSVGVGDTVTFVLKGTLPENVKSYHGEDGKNVYHMTFTDTMGEALTTDATADSVKIYVGDGSTNQANLPDNATLVDLTESGLNDGDIKVEGQKLTVDIPNIFALMSGHEAGIAINDASTKNPSVIYVVYTAVINSKAKVSASGNAEGDAAGLANAAHLSFSNDPNALGAGPTTDTPDDKTQLYTYALDLQKHEGTSTGPALTAGFSIVQGDATGESLKHGKITQDDKGVYGIGEGKVAWFTRTGDSAANYVYKFAGWHDPVKVDSTYVAWFNESNDTGVNATHMHEGMLVPTLDAKGHGIHTGTAADGEEPTHGTVEYYQVVITEKTGDSAAAKIEGLDEGAYTVFESLIPQGYDGMNPYTFLLDANESFASTELKVDQTSKTPLGSDGQFAESYGAGPEGTTTGSEAKLDLINHKAVDLPITGGMGTALFVGAGVVLVVTACAYTVSRKRHAAEDAE